MIPRSIGGSPRHLPSGHKTRGNPEDLTEGPQPAEDLTEELTEGRPEKAPAGKSSRSHHGSSRLRDDLRSTGRVGGKLKKPSESGSSHAMDSEAERGSQRSPEEAGGVCGACHAVNSRPGDGPEGTGGPRRTRLPIEEAMINREQSAEDGPRSAASPFGHLDRVLPNISSRDRGAVWGGQIAAMLSRRIMVSSEEEPDIEGPQEPKTSHGTARRGDV